MKAAAAAVLLGLLLAGCTESTQPTADEATGPQVIVDANRPTESFGQVVTGPAVGPDVNATTEAAPRLVLGEWWRVRFESFLGDPVEVVRVVADVNDEGYIMGMPHEGWLKEAISFHSPAFGDVGFDLSYNTHNVKFEPVRFPLTQGATWETAFATAPYIATVESSDKHTATIVLMPPENPQPTDAAMPVLAAAGAAFPSGKMTLVYDARQHEVVSMESDIGKWTVVEHGYDFQGWVTVPRGEHTAIDYGAGMFYTPPKMDPRPKTLTVDGGYNRMTMMHFAGTVGDAPGYLKIRDVTPAGEEFLTEVTGSGFHIKFYETAQPDGTWTVEDVVGGAGFTYSMGIAYHQYDIHLPDGARRTDHSHAVVR